MYRTRSHTKKYNPRKTRKQLDSGQKACPFCTLPKSQIVDKRTSMLVIKNIFPYQFWDFMKVTDHLMVTPIRHVDSLHDFTSHEKEQLVGLLAEYQEKGYNFYVRESGNVIKSVPHQHTHLIKCDSKTAKFLMYLRKPHFLIRF